MARRVGLSELAGDQLEGIAWAQIIGAAQWPVASALEQTVGRLVSRGDCLQAQLSDTKHLPIAISVHFSLNSNGSV